MSLAGRFLYHLCRLGLGAVFLYAGAVKAADVQAFAGSIAAYHLLPYQLNILLAAGLPYVELLAGVLLLANRRVRPAALVLAGLTVVFMGALASAWLRGLNIDCGCFRPGAHTSIPLALLRDAGILVLAHYAYHLRGAQGR